MTKVSNSNKLIVLLTLDIGLFIYYIIKMPSMLSNQYYNMYVVNLISMVIMLTIFTVLCSSFPMDIFDPFVLTSAIYFMIFAICPLEDIIRGTTAVYNFDPVNGAVKGTIIFLVSYISFVIGYCQKKKYCYYDYLDFDISCIKVNNLTNLIMIAFVLWGIGLAGTFVYLIGNGLSIRYILTLGMDSNSTVMQASGTPLGFIGMLTFTMITACIYIVLFHRSKIIKTIVYAITMICLLVRGFRSIIIILMVAPILYMYVRKGKRPKLLQIIFFLLCVILMIAVVGYFRNDLRTGGGVSLDNFGFDVIYKTVASNFRRYNIFYGMVDALPSRHDFTYGRNLLYTITMIVPRFFWPGKPQPVMREILNVSTTELIASTGAAWPNIGEYYMEFGVPGCIIFMYILGRVFSRLRLYFNSEYTTTHSLMGYSVFFPSLVTIIAYGYTPSTAYMLLFLLIPVFAMRMAGC